MGHVRMCVWRTHKQTHTYIIHIYIYRFMFVCYVANRGYKAENAPPTPRKIVGQFHFIFAVSRGAKCAGRGQKGLRTQMQDRVLGQGGIGSWKLGTA